jgi:SAM-dependent methyltransferase
MTELRNAATGSDPRSTPGYRLAASGRESAEDERLALLEHIFDPASRRRRALVQPGWRCLEVGAGRGSMAVWLAEQVGPTGHVVATDVDVRYLERLKLPNLEIRQHNILDDSIEALGPSFDMVSSRLMLFWLAGRQENAIRRMAQCLRPGGWLVDEDGDWGTVRRPIRRIPLTPATIESGARVSGGRTVGTIRRSDASYRHCSSAAV